MKLLATLLMLSSFYMLALANVSHNMRTDKLKILRKKYTQIRLLGQQIDNSLSNDLTKCEIEIKIYATGGNPFDLFILRNSSDFECYMRAISDFSFTASDAYACPFLSDANATHLN